MGEWKAVSSGNVDEQSLRAVLNAHGTTWESASHVTATSSLARGVRMSGEVGLSIATLTDLIVLPGVPGLELPLDGFPGPDVLKKEGPQAYALGMTGWQHQATSRKLRQGLQFDDALRRYSRENLTGHRTEQLLVKSRREFSRSIHALISAGVHPHELSAHDDLSRTAVAAWAWLEDEIPSLTAARTDLWIDLDEFEGQSTPHARNLRHRIEQALECAFGTSGGRRRVVHHGFYFYTPSQWALFQLLGRIPDVDQLFIIHDDGSNPAFETWRRFFTGEWKMPVPIDAGPALRGENEAAKPTPAATALLQALRGEAVATGGLAESLTVLECRSPVELVRRWQTKTEEGKEPPRRFAADAESIERFVRRLGRETDSGTTDLAQLPLGAFLLALHNCITLRADGSPGVVLSEDALLDIASSGYLPSSKLEKPTIKYVSALQRALPFFKGCKDGQDWRERAKQLQSLIADVVEPLDRQDPKPPAVREPRATDEQRIKRAAGNPLRLVPWADLSSREAKAVVQMIDSTVALVEEFAPRARVALEDHIELVRLKLDQGMRELPAEERREIEAKVKSFSIGLDDEIDVEGLLDVVNMLLGRTAEFDIPGDRESGTAAISELRGLDELGLHKQDQDLHVTNLAEGIFPSSIQTVGWPFSLDEIDSPAATVNGTTVEILKTRADTAALSDLYLFWLALNGVKDKRHITLSWISKIEGEQLSPSSFLSLLTPPEVKSRAVQARAGGLSVEHVHSTTGTSDPTEHPVRPASTASPAKLAKAVNKIDPRAAASAKACARRLALQWILGPSHAFQAEHHQEMLYGNIAGALTKLDLFSETDTQRIVPSLWPHLTPGQRASSLEKRQVDPKKKNSSHGLWTLTLKGRGNKPPWPDGAPDGPLEEAYRAAVEQETPSAETVIPAGSRYLPPGTDDHKICRACPVRPSCAVWAENATDVKRRLTGEDSNPGSNQLPTWVRPKEQG